MSAETPEALFAAALADFQSSLPSVGKDNTASVKSDKGSYKYSYADLTAVTDAALPLLAKCGLSWTSRPTMTEHGFVLRYSLLHSAGHREDGDFPLPDPSRFSSQQIGSAITYARRYSLCAVTGIAPGGDDDDGEKALGAVARGNNDDIAVRDPGRSRGKTQRSKPESPQDDPWAAPLERTTDVEWFADIQARLDLCGTPGEVRGLIDEARAKWHEGKLSDADSVIWKQATEARLTELGAS